MRHTGVSIGLICLALTALGGFQAALSEGPTDAIDSAMVAQTSGPDQVDGNNEAMGENEPEPYVEYYNSSRWVTDVSSGADGPSLQDSDPDWYFCNAEDVPDRVRVRVEWKQSHPFSDLEFRLDYPTEPPKVRGSSPLVWEHELAEGDREENCFRDHLRADQSGVNVVSQEVRLRIVAAFNGAELP